MAFENVPKPGTRAFNDTIDTQARAIVRAYFAAPAGKRDEAEVRRRLAALVGEARVPQEVARQFVNMKGLDWDFLSDLEGRLQVYLIQDITEKLDLGRLLSASLCGWARQLLLRQARTAFRSECNSRRAQPVDDVSHPKRAARPGVHPTVRAVAQETPEDLDDELNEEFVLTARRACRRENDVHLVEWLLRQKYGFHPPERVALSVAPFGQMASQLLQSQWAEEDREVLPRQASEAVLSSARALRHAPSDAVTERFILLVSQASENRLLAKPLAQAWLAKWVEVMGVGVPKTEHERSRDDSDWRRVAAAAVKEGLLGARSTNHLSEVVEKLFWQAHYRVAAARRRVA